MTDRSEVSHEMRMAVRRHLEENPHIVQCRGGKHSRFRTFPKGTEWSESYESSDKEATHEIRSECPCGEVRRERAKIVFSVRKGRIVGFREFTILKSIVKADPNYGLKGWGYIPAWLWEEEKARLQFIQTGAASKVGVAA